jgi:mannose/fructose/N-acetylgalactosamine-specific phosphotransferase system component IIB
MIVLSRIDDRLIHGQVVEGWLRVIQAGRIVVVSDQTAADPFQASLMRLAVPPGVEVTVLSIKDADAALKEDRWSEERVLLLMPGLKEARRLAEAGSLPSRLNLGGLHDAPGRKTLTPSLSLGPEDKADVKALLACKVVVDTRALPGDEDVPVADYLASL